MKTSSLFTTFLSIFILTTVAEGATPVRDCEASPERIMQAYNAVISDQKTSENLQCLLTLHQSGSGLIKLLAGDALRPLLGGKALAGRTLNSQNQATVQRLQKEALATADVVHESFLTEYARGTWSFYDLFCKPQNADSCTLFLPDEEQIKKQSSLLGSSSLILLRTAYLGLQGENQKQVETRLRNLYASIPQNDLLKRKVIEQIYQELFGIKVPLA
jgi:hypothetical protein